MGFSSNSSSGPPQIKTPNISGGLVGANGKYKNQIINTNIATTNTEISSSEELSLIENLAMPNDIKRKIDFGNLGNWNVTINIAALGYTEADITYDFGVIESNGKKYYALNFTDGKQIWFSPVSGHVEIVFENGIADKYNCNLSLTELGYDSSTDIESYEGYKTLNNQEYLVINFTDGKQGWFDKDTGKITWMLDRTYNTTTYYDYDISEEEKQEIYDLYNLDKTKEFDYIATIKKGDHEVKVYSINAFSSKVSFENTNNLSSIFSKYYSEEQLTLLDKYFAGILISEWKDSSWPEGENYAAYMSVGANGKSFVFIPGDNIVDLPYYANQVPLHEMGHIYESAYKSDNNFDQETWNKLYENKKWILPWLSGSGYTPPSHWTTPNEREFFADSTANYYIYPNELKRFMPEVYYFLNNLYKYYDE